MGPPGPDHAGAAEIAPNLTARRRSVEITKTRRPQGPRRAHGGAHRGPFWGPFLVGRIIPLRLQGMGRKSACGAHWGPRGAHWGPRPLPLSLGPSGPAAHTGRHPQGRPLVLVAPGWGPNVPDDRPALGKTSDSNWLGDKASRKMGRSRRRTTKWVAGTEFCPAQGINPHTAGHAS